MIQKVDQHLSVDYLTHTLTSCVIQIPDFQMVNLYRNFSISLKKSTKWNHKQLANLFLHGTLDHKVAKKHEQPDIKKTYIFS